jgi:hypothetical protein
MGARPSHIKPPQWTFCLQKKLDDHPSKVLRHSVEVPEGDMHEPAILIKAAFENETMKMGIES